MLTSRKLQERWDGGDIKGEWEPCSVDTRDWSDSDFTRWVKAANAKNKADGTCTRYRSVADDSGDSW